MEAGIREAFAKLIQNVAGMQWSTILDLLGPNFASIPSTVQSCLGVDLDLYVPSLLSICAAIFSLSYIFRYLQNFIEGKFMSSILIDTGDEVLEMVLGWVSQQGFVARCRNTIANTDSNLRVGLVWRYLEDGNEEDDACTAHGSTRPLRYTPSYGTHVFWYCRQLVLFERRKDNFKQELCLRCFGRSQNVLRKLLADARQHYLAKNERKTFIYHAVVHDRPDNPQWKRCMARSPRPLSTVILTDDVKNDLVNDISDYLQPTTRKWYTDRGIPYRRGYLLYGPPGTGKSSLSVALSGHFNLNIYVLSLSSPIANDDNIATLFSHLPRRCIVLLEDVDTTGLTHTRQDGFNQKAVVPTEQARNNVLENIVAYSSNRLSLSGLLNVIDGVASAEGRVLIMTTNYLERLDGALIRLGRVDMKVQFIYADSSMVASMFRAIYCLDDKESTNLRCNARSLERVDELSQKFANMIPECQFSPAKIQGFLLQYKSEPLAALEAAKGWAEKTTKEGRRS